MPKFGTKLFFWIVLGSISTFFAEVISGSFLYPFLPFVDAWGIVMVVPLYTMHVLVLSYIVYNFGKPRLYTLFFAGAIFGMYEAYETGILWTGWDAGPVLTIMEFGVIEAIILVLFWHPLMSFILPVVIGETFLAKTKASLVDFKLSKKHLVPLVVLFGFIQAFNVRTPASALLAGLANIPLVAFLIFLWRKYHLGKYTMKELLPNKRQFVVISLLMFAQYLLLGFFNAEKFPSLVSQSFVWLVYLVLFFLFYLSLKKSKQEKGDVQVQKPPLSWKMVAKLSVVLVASSMIFSVLFTPFRSFMWLFIFMIYLVVGVWMLVYSLKKIFQKT